MLQIIYQDEWLVAVNKPANMLVHRSWLARHETRFVMQTLRDQLGQHVFTVHRLDRPTSGVLLFGLSSEAGHRLSKCFEQHQLQKTYLAVVRGWLTESGHLDYPLAEELDKIADKRSSERLPQAALTDYRPLAHTEQPVAIGRYPTSRYTLMQLQPRTGRKHQLRRHMSHLRHPIIGDTAHGDLKQNRGAAEHFDCRRLMLHASQLNLIHPFTEQPLCLEAGLDKTWYNLAQQFNWQQALATPLALPAIPEWIEPFDCASLEPRSTTTHN